MLRRYAPAVRSQSELAALQRERLAWTLQHAYSHSDFYRRRFDTVGVHPEMFKTIDDLRRFPVTTADDFRDGYPLPLLAAANRDIVRIHASSGTTGKRKVVAYTQKDIDDWLAMFCRCYEMAGLTREDRVQICVGYGVWTAGAGFQLACERYGAMALPTGPGNLDLQCTFLVDFSTTILCCTSSMALLLAEEVQRRGLRDQISLRKVICGSERTSKAMRRRIVELLGLEEFYDIPGLTEVYGPGTGLNCHCSSNIHYWADYYYLEFLDPETLEPVPEGEIGEMVYTTLYKEATPLVRYRSRDLSRAVAGPCPCGSIMPRHSEILGRSDDVFIIRGVNVYPSEIDAVLSGTAGLGSEYQIHLDHQADGRDYLTLKVERQAGVGSEQDELLQKALISQIKHRLLVTPRVELLAYGELPRSERKTQRVFDRRYD
ncbi:MAG: phenylacetate--CoA ligase [Deltaproteobacteria bacterium]|nr:phenylacetate--CoA ligase [Deltaproteobacteria bacterium]